MGDWTLAMLFLGLCHAQRVVNRFTGQLYTHCQVTFERHPARSLETLM